MPHSSLAGSHWQWALRAGSHAWTGPNEIWGNHNNTSIIQPATHSSITHTQTQNPSHFWVKWLEVVLVTPGSITWHQHPPNKYTMKTCHWQSSHFDLQNQLTIRKESASFFCITHNLLSSVETRCHCWNKGGWNMPRLICPIVIKCIHSLFLLFLMCWVSSLS